MPPKGSKLHFEVGVYKLIDIAGGVINTTATGAN